MSFLLMLKDFSFGLGLSIFFQEKRGLNCVIEKKYILDRLFSLLYTFIYMHTCTRVYIRMYMYSDVFTYTLMHLGGYVCIEGFH